MKYLLIKKILLLSLLYIYSSSVAQDLPSATNAAPSLSEEGSYTWILLPDPQTYSKFGRNQSIFVNMIDWINDQNDNLNIQMVLCTGDLVEQNNIVIPDSINGDQSSHAQWQFISSAFYKLNNKVPYILCTGNHDYGTKSAENRYSQFNSYFPPQINPLNDKIILETFPNAEGANTLENAAYVWDDPSGRSFLIFSLEFAPRMEVIKWADSLAKVPQYKEHLGVLLTHSYLNSDGRRTHQENYPLKNAHYGKVIWDKFVSQSPQVQFVFAGHIANSDTHRDQVGYRQDKNAHGKPVHQMLFNAQREGGGWHGNGGDGWLRILEFIPQQRKVKVKTFSPYFFISPGMRSNAWRTAEYDEYEMIY
ncbi:calcineurin-like phosphoesterase family protein [Sphingobacterium yanglingense]|uniref:Calcineurin-like phosphoesterase family protein n=2 Tax=Sphingobacterium yanglingense TaxID=1437280 RepID=A0A4R6WEW3_9SPHI|nr:calcineurin-like phosphoesterase family protein [Sphingobacterium yanglingense]